MKKKIILGFTMLTLILLGIVLKNNQSIIKTKYTEIDWNEEIDDIMIEKVYKVEGGTLIEIDKFDYQLELLSVNSFLNGTLSSEDEIKPHLGISKSVFPSVKESGGIVNLNLENLILSDKTIYYYAPSSSFEEKDFIVKDESKSIEIKLIDISVEVEEGYVYTIYYRPVVKGSFITIDNSLIYYYSMFNPDLGGYIEIRRENQ